MEISELKAKEDMKKNVQMILEAKHLEKSAFNESYVTSLIDFERQITQTTSDLVGSQIIEALKNLETYAAQFFIDEQSVANSS